MDRPTDTAQIDCYVDRARCGLMLRKSEALPRPPEGEQGRRVSLAS